MKGFLLDAVWSKARILQKGFVLHGCFSTGSCTGILGSPLDDQSQEPRWYWPRVFLRCTSGRLGQSITLTETLAFVCWIS